MNRIIRFYNQNRKMFWLIVIGIIAIIVLVQVLNNYYKNANKDSSGIKNTTTYNANTTPAITGEKVEEKTSTKSINIIDNFIKACNNKEVEKAYNMLSKDCKEALYPDVETFKKNYCDVIFDEYKIYDIQSWITTANKHTYRIQLTEDILSTGKTSELSTEEFYTLINEDGEYKLNIHNYIGKETVNATNTVDNIEFRIIEKNIYEEDETYKIEVKNNTNKKIMIDSKEKTRTVRVVDTNGLAYVAFLNEIGTNNLIVLPGITKQIEIKFNKSYNPDYKEDYIEFTDIVLDLDNKENRTKIKIEL